MDRKIQICNWHHRYAGEILSSLFSWISPMFFTLIDKATDEWDDDMQERSFYIPGREVPFFDSRIDDTVLLVEEPEKELEMIIGIENMQGKVYREITVYSFDNFSDLIDQLAGINLVDVFPATYYTHSGYDSRLRLAH